jgi:hypothetical protein
MIPITKVNCKYGAPMGRMNVYPADRGLRINKMYLGEVRLDSGGYDSGGAYWGLTSETLYRATSYHTTILQSEIFVWAKNRKHAKEQILEELPNVKFCR